MGVSGRPGRVATTLGLLITQRPMVARYPRPMKRKRRVIAVNDRLVPDGHAHKWLGWARHDARPGSCDHRAGAVGKEPAAREGEARDEPRSCFLVTRGGALRLDQDLAGSAVPADVALLLSHRDQD